MRVWTEATFREAAELDPDTQDPVLWLSSREPGRRLGTVLDAIDRAGSRVGRITAVIGFGFLASGAIPNSALAPVGSAHAAGERFKLQPVFPVLVEHVNEPTVRGIDPIRPVTAVPAAVAIPPAATVTAVEDMRAVTQSAPDRPAELAMPAATPRSEIAAASPSPGEIRHPSFEESRDEVEDYLRFGSRELPRRLVETIVKAAHATDVDPIYLMALADKESSFRTEVRAATSSAEGLFQFIERTWLDTVKAFGPKHGLGAEAALIETVDDKPTVADDADRTRILNLRRDPYVAAVMAAEMLRRDAALIGLKIGRELNATEMYLAHFLGLDGATRFIAMKAARKAKSATAAFPAAARANASIFFERGRKGRRKGLSVPEVYAKIDRMIDARLEMFRPVKVMAEAGPNG
ncbi:transglycosylase SLT domain-containing protein [Enterovirga aerilata]|uniref:Transglycosylase SLT domain-containing protein n=1 Tax=Enterovirga aerilata TaxID=2730920 RepID=A0A849I368_9HYPH|nr:transglycosylase SLT domain-containing protein [Enterovirga sp. DB1703]NNM71808.1 transglycosylase SLT domain-containing protein [Enterovirga sp. DB1703]